MTKIFPQVRIVEKFRIDIQPKTAYQVAVFLWARTVRSCAITCALFSWVMVCVNSAPQI
jgi:hypothetical protein